MNQFQFRPKALEDLRELLIYITKDSPAAAERMHDSILESCRILATHLSLMNLKA